MAKCSIVSLNVRGLRSDKRYSVFRWIEVKSYDIILLQETFCTRDYEEKFKVSWNGNTVHSFSNSSHCKGVCILFREGFDYNIISTFTDNDGRIVLVNVSFGGIEYTICNIYCPNDVKERISFLKKVKLFINKNAISKKNLILGGDVNCVDDMNDRSSKKLDKSSEIFSKIKMQLKVTDAWRKLHPQVTAYTFIDPTGNSRNSRIDVLLASTSVISNIQNCDIVYSPAPDHKAVVLEVSLNIRKRGRGYWKLNNSVLTDDEYKNGICKIYNEVISTYSAYVSKGLLWEYFKKKVKEYSISFCIARARDKRKLIEELEYRLKSLDDQLAKNGDTSKYDCRDMIKKELDMIYNDIAKGYQVRARARWVEHGERSTHYFLNLEKQRQNNNLITCLKDNEGVKHYDDAKILDVAKCFYTNLYSSDAASNDDIDAYFNEIDKENIYIYT